MPAPRAPDPHTRTRPARPIARPKGASSMRFMLMMKGDPPAETPAADGADRPANEAFVAEIVRAMRAYSGELRKAGVLLDEGGLYPSWTAKGIHFASGATPRVVDGPFTESKEVIAGYYLIEVSSEAEAIEWAKR